MLARTFGCARFAYNHMLRLRSDAWMQRQERVGYHETSAALTALIGCGCDLPEACGEAFSYLDHCLGAGFRPGMGHVVPDRMFWAEPEDEDEEEEKSETDSEDGDENSTPSGQAAPGSAGTLSPDTMAAPAIATGSTDIELPSLDGFAFPPHDTKH